VAEGVLQQPSWLQQSELLGPVDDPDPTAAAAAASADVVAAAAVVGQAPKLTSLPEATKAWLEEATTTTRFLMPEVCKFG
jgi:hypothetical protein